MSRQRVEIDGRRLQVSNLEKVLFPEVGFTKAQVIDYYVRIAPVLLPHVAGRPVTFTRWPDGVGGQAFFEKNSARHAPEWLPRITVRRGRRVERHFWQPGGGCDRNITEPSTLRAMIDYIHLNPVRRGLVTRARDWRWSSAAWFEGLESNDLIPDPIPPEWTLGWA